MANSSESTPTTGPADPEEVSPSIARIRRLERLEQDRLDEKFRRDERRRQVVSSNKPSGGRHDLVDHIERVTKFPLSILGIAWLVIAIIVLTKNVNGSSSTVLVGALFVVWVVLFVEYLVRLIVSPDRRGYLRRRWVEPATVVVPPLQVWHTIGIEKVTLVVHEARLRVEVVLKHHSLFRVSLRRRAPCS